MGARSAESRDLERLLRDVPRGRAALDRRGSAPGSPRQSPAVPSPQADGTASEEGGSRGLPGYYVRPPGRRPDPAVLAPDDPIRPSEAEPPRGRTQSRS